MKITPIDENHSDGFHRLKVEAAWTELSADYDVVVAGYAKATIPGFRPGKVPRSVIEKRFQREIMDDLSYRAAQRLGREAILEAGIDVLGLAETEEIQCKKGESLRAQLRFYPMPEINVPDLRCLKIDKVGIDPLDQISLKLLELVRLDIPDGLVQDELAFDGNDGSTPDSQEWQTAHDQIKLMLILKKIAKQEGIEVDEMDVDRRIAEKAEEFNTTKKSLQAEFKKGGGLQRLRDMLLAESTLEYLMEKSSQ
jgi:FKBP-type peptidyl-prolyl cis-trans isomerase (trigger factor)